MNDHTRGEAPGGGHNADVPLKRDRKLLRSSKPLPTRNAPASEPVADLAVESRRDPDVSPVEQLFGEPWPPSHPDTTPPTAVPVEADQLPGGGAVGAYDVDLTGETLADPASPVDRRKRFMLGFGRKAEPQLDADPDDLEPGDGEDTAPGRSEGEAPTEAFPPEPYVPPGGFTGPGHPTLGPLAPMPPQQHPGLAALDVAALVASVVVPPIGLITAVVAIIKGKRIRGWASDLARTAVSVAVVMSLVFAGVGGYIWVTETERAEQLAAVRAEQRAHELVRTASEPFCEVLAANPTIYATADPDYGWPAVDSPGGYNRAIAEYSAVWAQLAEVAPAGIAEETAAISQRVARVVSIANALGSSNRAGDLLGLHEQDDLATVESWYVEYCDAPEVPAE